MLRAAIYSRVSTSRQATERNVSLAVQQERAQTYCQRHGYTVLTEYTDVVSGRRDDRVQYQAMLASCDAGEVDVIVSMFLDRFGRNTDEILLRVISLRRMGITVECTDEDVSNPLIGLVQAWKAGEESKRIGERTRAAIVRKIASGSHFGRVGMGWRRERDDHGSMHLVIHEEEAALLRRMASMLVDENLTLRGIARQLNAEGHRRPAGGEWTAGTVGPLLLRPSNGGTLVYGRTNKHNPRGAKESASCQVPALFPPEVVERVREKMALHRALPKGHSQTSRHLLAGLARCGVCGFPIVGTGHPPRGSARTTMYYVCSKWREIRSCTATRFWRSDEIEAAVLSELARFTDAQIADQLAPAAPEVADTAAHLDRARLDLADVERDLLAEHRLLRAGVVDEAQFGQIAAGLRDRRTALEQRIQALSAAAEAAEKRKARASTLPGIVREFTAEAAALDPMRRKARLQEIVSRVVCYPDGRFAITLRG